MGEVVVLSTDENALRTRRRSWSDAQVGMILATPAVILLGAVALVPLISSMVSGFFDQSLLSPDRTFVGFDNLFDVLQGPFWDDLLNTFWFTVWATALPAVIGLALALALNTRLPGASATRGFFLLPWVLPGVVTSFVWLWIFNANYGVLNGALRAMGIIDANVNWLGAPDTAFAAIIVTKTWESVPWIAMMILAGLQSIDKSFYEAAEIDGAGRWARLTNVTLPRLRPVLATVLLLELTWNLQHFETIYVLTRGGPAGSTTTLSIDVYTTAFRGFDLGRAGALGILWMILISAFIVVYLRVINRNSDD